MSLLNAFPHDVVILRPGEGVDEYGNKSTSWEKPKRINARGWLRALESVEESNPERVRVSTGFRLYVPTSADVRAHDRVEVGSEVFEVEAVRNPNSPSGSLTYRVARLRRWEG
jgi:head-tail adaptor